MPNGRGQSKRQLAAKSFHFGPRLWGQTHRFPSPASCVTKGKLPNLQGLPSAEWRQQQLLLHRICRKMKRADVCEALSTGVGGVTTANISWVPIRSEA